MDKLLSDIEAFLSAHKMSATRFGEAAMNDRHLVRTLRTGRRLWPETEEKVRRYMVTYRAEAA